MKGIVIRLSFSISIFCILISSLCFIQEWKYAYEIGYMGISIYIPFYILAAMEIGTSKRVSNANKIGWIALLLIPISSVLYMLKFRNKVLPRI